MYTSGHWKAGLTKTLARALLNLTAFRSVPGSFGVRGCCATYRGEEVTLIQPVNQLGSRPACLPPANWSKGLNVSFSAQGTPWSGNAACCPGRQCTCSFGLGTELCLGLNLPRPSLPRLCGARRPMGNLCYFRSVLLGTQHFSQKPKS